MIAQITLTRNELFLIKEMIPLWQKYADGFVFMDDCSTDGTYEYLMDNKDDLNIIDVLQTEYPGQPTNMESVVRQRLFDAAFDVTGNVVCLDTDEYFDGHATKDMLEQGLESSKDTLFHAPWIQYTDTNKIRVDGPWGHNFKDRIGSYGTRGIFGDASMHSEHLPVPKNQAMINMPTLFIAHLQWLDKKTVAVKQYYWKIVDYVNKIEHGVDIIPASAYDASVNNFEWDYADFDFPLKVSSDIYDLHDIEDSFKYKFIKESIEKYNIPNLNDWGMGIH
jgi:hypothetical protein